MPEPTVNLEEEAARLHEILKRWGARHVPLPVAAAMTFHQAHRNTKAIITREDYDDALNMAAAALSRLVPVYRIDDPAQEHAAVAVDLTRHRFARGATELRGGNQAPLRDLSVRQGDLQSALSLIRRAGITFTLALSPEPSPTPLDLGQTPSPAGR
jgi:hypothetical protein